LARLARGAFLAPLPFFSSRQYFRLEIDAIFDCHALAQPHHAEAFAFF
jgi:hypothetical protein